MIFIIFFILDDFFTAKAILRIFTPSEIGLIVFVLLLFFFVFLFFKVVKNFTITKNYFLILNSFIILVYFIPFMPRGSFFTNWNAIIFWTIVAFLNANLAVLRKPND